MVRLEFELPYYDPAVEHVTYNELNSLTSWYEITLDGLIYR